MIAASVFSNVYLSCVLCAPCCQCLWIVHSWLPHRFSLTFICHVSCAPNVASVWIVHSWLPPSVFSNVYLSCVLCAQCCECLWIVHSWLPHRFSLTFICPVSCVPNVAVSLDCSILITPIGFLKRLFVLCLVCPMLRCLWIVQSWLPPSVFSNVYLPCVLCAQCCGVSGLFNLDYPHRFSQTFICPVSCVPNVAVSLDCSILITPIGFLKRLFVLCFVCPMLRCLWIVQSWLPPSVFSNVYLSCVLCVQCCQCLWIVHSWLPIRCSLTFICPVSCATIVASVWIVHSWLPHRFSQTFICPVSCVPNVAVSLDCSILITPIGFLKRLFVLCLVCPMLRCLWIVQSWLPPSVFSNVYLSCVLCAQCCGVSGLFNLDYPHRFSQTFICPVSCVPNVAVSLDCSILITPIGFLKRLFVLCLVRPMLSVSLDCTFLITHSVFSNVYLSCVLCDYRCQCLDCTFLITHSVFSNVYLSCVLCDYCCQCLDCSFLITPSVFSNVYLSCVLCVQCWRCLDYSFFGLSNVYYLHRKTKLIPLFLLNIYELKDYVIFFLRLIAFICKDVKITFKQ